MKSKLELALLGIILQSVDFILDFDVFQLNITSAIAFVLIIIGLLPYKTEQNRLFSKCLKSSIRIAVIFAVSVVMTVFNFATYNSSVSMLFFAIISVLYMYMTYYFTECIVLQAKMVAKQDISKTMKSTWTLLGVGIVGYYFVASMNLGIIVLIVHVAYILAALYYAMTVRNLWNQITEV
ncbi:MAG: hypothetical protein E7252_00835 [Lachnospira sp.]|nr:hypothetical protein [Lachnospira sp.]